MGGALTVEERGGAQAAAATGRVRSAGVMLCVLATVTVPVGFVLRYAGLNHIRVYYRSVEVLRVGVCARGRIFVG